MKLLKFEASWCGPCKAMDHILDLMELNMEVEKINIDHNVQLAQDNDIKSVPTVILIDDKGKEVDRLIGLKTLDELKEFVEN